MVLYGPLSIMKKIFNIVTKFHKILIKTIQHRCDVLIYEKTCIRTGATVTLNAPAIVKVWATKFHKILIETITFREWTLHAYPVVVVRIS